MNCRQCGNIIPDDAEFCSYCNYMQTKDESTIESKRNKIIDSKVHEYKDLPQSKKVFLIVINIFFALIILFAVDLISGSKLGLVKLTKIIILGSDEADWRKAKKSYSISNLHPLETYISKHPDGKHMGEANDLLESLYWDKTISLKTLEAYEKYIHRFPNGKNYNTAIDEIDWFNTIKLNSPEAHSKYIENHPLGKYVRIALEEIAWTNAVNANTIDAFY